MIACTLGLFGTVRAQETIVIGETTEVVSNLPLDIYNGCGLSQQMYLADEISHTSGTITSLAVKFYGEVPYSGTLDQVNLNATFERKTAVYVNNTELNALSGGVNLTEGQTPNFDGTITYVPGEWAEFVFDTPFQYEGGNIIVTMYDYTNTGEGYYQEYYYFHGDYIYNRSVMKNITTTVDNEYLLNLEAKNLTPQAKRNQIQFTFAAAGEGGEEGGEGEGDETEELASEFAFDFEDGTLDGWRVFQGQYASGDNWQLSEGKGKDGSKGIYSASCVLLTFGAAEYYPQNYVVTTDAYLIKETSELTWYMDDESVYYSPSDDAYQVVVSEDGTNFTPIWTGNGAGASENTISLAEYAGKTLYLGFYHYIPGSYGDGEIRLDNITLTAGEGGETPVDPEPEQPTEPEQPNDGYQDIIAEVGANMNPSASNNYNVPAYDYNAYSVSQQIYLAEELGGMVGEINSVSFKFGVYTRQPITRQYEVYLTHTDLEVFNEYNFVAVSESDKVFDGDVYLEGTADTWFTIEFDKAFNYEGGNFILTVYDKSGVSAGNDYHYFYRYLTTKRALLWKNGPYDIYNMTGTGSSMAYVNQLQLGMTVSSTPTVPQNLVAVATGASTIALSWNTVGVATSYNVYSNGQLLANVEGTTYTVEGLTADTEYCYTVAAVNGELVSDASTAACAKTTAPAPSAPTGLVATADVTTIALSWNAAETAVSYNIYKGTDVIATAVTETTYNVQDLTPETEYCFTVTAVNAGGESAASEAVCATTLEFTGCYVIFTLKDSYGDGWYQDKLVVSYDGITKDLVFTENSNAKTKEYVLGIPQDAHVTVVYQAGVQYSYPAEESIVIAYESGREIYSLATLSNGCNFEFDVNCAPAVPDKPIVAAKATGESTIELTVTTVAADSYTIYLGTEVVATGLTTATYTVEGLTADTEYCFTVKSTNEVGESELSEAACAKTYKAGSAIVQIGDETSTLYGYYAPVSNMGYYANYSLSQQIYLKEELGGEPCAITSVSFQNYSGGPNTRNIVVYMTNIDDAKDTFEGGAGDWVVVSEADIVYQGQHTFGVQGDWTTIEFETPFIYRGKNVCITVNDLTGVTKQYTGYDMFYVTETESVRGIYATNQTSQFDCSNLTATALVLQNQDYDYNTASYTYTKYIVNAKLRTEPAEVEALPLPSTPANLVAESTGISSIALTWDAAENAATYNVYQGEELIATNLVTTSYAVEGLADGTEYCFTVTAVNLEGESEASEQACATTEDFDGCFVVFTLKDTYGDGWTGNYLEVKYGETTETLGFSVADFNYKEYSKEYVLPLATGTNVTVSFVVPQNSTWPSENGFVVSYQGGEEIINVPTGTFVDNNVGTFAYDPFVVNCGGETEEPTPDEPVVDDTEYRLVSTGEGWKTVTYVYESETSDKVIEIREGENADYGYITFLQYDENGVLTGYEYGWAENGAIVKTGYNYQYTVVEYTYTEGVLTAYTETEYTGWSEPDATEYTITRDAEGNITEVAYGTSKVVYAYEKGKLVNEVKSYYNQWAETPGYETEYEIEYTYDENGNCTLATQYSTYSGERVARKGTEYVYATTIPAENVVAFAYPHAVAPAHANLIAKAISYEFREDYNTGEITKDYFTVTPYVYNPEVVSEPLAPMGLTVSAVSDTELVLSWVAVESAEKFYIYKGEEFFAESETTTYNVTGLESATEYCFSVSGVNGELESPKSEVVCGKTLDLVAIYPTEIAFGEVRVGNYWAKEETTASVEINTLGKTVTAITCDNAFFTVPTIDLTASYIMFELGYDKTAEAGEYTGNLVVTLEGGATVTALVTATAYAPAIADVFELAQEITFVDGVYTDTPDFATLHDDYLMPSEGEWNDGKLMDAVYTFTLETPSAVTVNVAGENAQYAIYKAEGFEYPTEETFNGIDRAITTAFSFDFNDGELGAFTIKDYDQYQEYTWDVEDDGNGGYKLVSYSFQYWYGEDNSYQYYNDADERIITNEAFNITEKSVLTFDMNVNGSFESVIVEVTKDGETFTAIETVGDNSYSYEWLDKRVNIGEKLAELGLEYGEYRISLYHDVQGYGELNIDNLVLAEREFAFPEGTYFLFAAAEKDLAVEVSVVETEEVVIVPEAKAYRLESVESFMTTVYTYDEVFTNRVVEMVEEGITTTLSYNKAGQVVSAAQVVEYEGEEGEPVEEVLSSIEYTYNEDGTLATYTETAPTPMGAMATTTTEYTYEDGRLVKAENADYEIEMTYVYNEDGTVKEIVEPYMTTVFTYENGNLVKTTIGWNDEETGEFFAEAEEVYTYANGNVVKQESYEYGSLYQVHEFFYDATVAAEDVYTFELPHMALTNVEPVSNNVLVKELSYYSYYDEEAGETIVHSYTMTVYNYNPAIEMAPITPINFAAEVVDGVVELTWEAFADAETFTVYQDGEVIAENVTEGFYAVEGLEAGEYCFVVRAYNAAGASASTNDVCVTIEGGEPTPTVPAAPVVRVAEVTATTIVLEWDAVEGATEYAVYFEGEKLGTLAGTIAGIQDLEPETTYCFTVTAINEVGESAHSEKVCATTLKGEGIAENATALNIYPNPAVDRVVIETEATIEAVSIYTLTGVMIYSEVDFNNNTINVSDFASGVYVMKVRTENGEVVKRFIKK